MGRGKKKKGGPGSAAGPFTTFPQIGPTASHDYFHAEFQDWFDGLTAAEQWAMKNYIGNSTNKMYQKLNKALRDGTFDPNAFPGSNMSNTMKGLDAAMNKNDGLPQNIVLHRGFSFSALHQAFSNGTLGVGDTIIDDAFMSTSTLESTAKGFVGAYPIKYRIKAPKGTRGAYMSWSPVNVYMHETEWLMPRGTGVRVDKLNFVNGVWEADVTVVEQ